MHATSVCLGKKAFLITGPSGIGKSALALALIHRGATLIADDTTRIRDGWAYAPKNHIGWMEIRGIGLVSGFPVCSKAPIGAVIELTDKPIERFPNQAEKIPVFHIRSNDVCMADKVLSIAQIISGHLKQERIE